MRNISKNIKKVKTAALSLLAAAGAAMICFGSGFASFADKAARISVMLLYGYSGTQFVPSETSSGSSPNTETKNGNNIYVDDSIVSSGGYRLVPSGENEDVSSEDPERAADGFDEDAEYEQGGRIVNTFYGSYYGDDYIDLPKGGQLRNLTDLPEYEIEDLAEQPPSFTITADGEPEVLIMHTHTTECYEPYEREYYDINRSCRVLDSTQNMTAVGAKIADRLSAAGIGVIHDTTVHDYPDYNGSYDRSRATVQNILERYPSVKIVLDIHRDAIERDGERISAVTGIDGKNAAQIMIICGCDDGTMDMPDYRKNLSFACALQSQIEFDSPTLTRPLLFDYRHYNQDLTAGSLLIEVGSHGNTLEQAEYSGELIGNSLANLLLELKEDT